MKAKDILPMGANKVICLILLFFVYTTLYFGNRVKAQTIVTKQLYLSDPSQTLDRIDPVATGDATTAQSASITPTSRFFYAFRGGSRTDFWRYDVTANSWTTMAATPGVVTSGGALTTDGTNLYAFRGLATDFWRYNVASNTWSTLAAAPIAVGAGAALVHINGVIYAFAGGNRNIFWKYTIATDTWAALATTPANVGWGGSLTSDSTNIFALRGNSSTDFWRYNVFTNTWVNMATAPATISAGGSLSFDGINLTALRGSNTNSVYRYTVSTNTWSSLTNTPSAVSFGGAIISDGPDTYALRGNNNRDLWKNTTGTWSAMSTQPSNTDSGAAIVTIDAVAARTTFTQSPTLCSGLNIRAGNSIRVVTHIRTVYGAMPLNPAITATLRYNVFGFPFTIITLTNPVYNSSTGALTFTGSLGSNLNVPSGVAISLEIASSQKGVSFQIEYDSQTKPSRIELPVTTFINVGSIGIYNAPYPGGILLSSATEGSTVYIRTTVTDPFGFADITGLNTNISPSGTTFVGVSVFGAGCTRIYENAWLVPASGIGSHTITATAKEGYENTVTHTNTKIVSGCIICRPTANTDAATCNGGEPVDINVLANDTDPNANINPSSLSVIGYPKNGDAIVDNGMITYLPNGTFSGKDTLIYEICDLTNPTPLCDTAIVIITVTPVDINTCGQAGKPKTYYMPYAENEASITLQRSANVILPSTNIRTIISIKVSYPNMRLTWDHWEDGYEPNILAPTQSTTQIWGDGDVFNGAAPGYPTDILPVGASIILDNTMPTPRVVANIFFDGKDKLYSTGQLSVTQVCGEPATIAVQCMKTNVSAYPLEFGKLFTLPVGQNLPSRDFRYTSLFLRASENNTSVQIDRDNDGDFETNFIMNEGQVVMVDSTTAPAGLQVRFGAIITSDKPIGLDAHFAGIDDYSSREVPVFPATWYSNTYYTPVPTTGPATAPLDTAVVMLYNSLNRPININWSSGVPSSGTIPLGANASFRFAMPLSATAAYKFVNPTGESFVAIEIVDSYTPVTEANSGVTRDWAFNLVSEQRLTDFGSVAWAPGSTNLTRNDNPIWVTPTANTTVYVKHNGDVLNGALTSPCGLKYDVAISVNQLNFIRIKDALDNDQSGTAVYTCDGAKIAAVYGEDPETAVAGGPSWDVGTTIQPFCKQKLVFAYDDYGYTLINNPVTINVIKNDAGFLAVLNPASITTTGLMQPKNGTVIINTDGTVVYVPNPGYVGVDTFQYSICSTPTPIVCATAYVYITIGACPTPSGKNIISGKVFLDKNGDGINNDGGTGIAPAKIYLYVDGNCSGGINPNELSDSVTVDINGNFQFIKAPDKIIADNFDLANGSNSCATGTDGNSLWQTDWYDSGDPSNGFCVSPANTAANTDVEIVADGATNFAIRLDDANRAAIREFNMQGASKALLSFSFRRGSATFSNSESVLVQLSSNGGAYTTIYTIVGTNTTNATYTDVANININVASYNGNNRTLLRFITSANTDESDDIYIDNVNIRMLQYNLCYLLSLDPSSITAGTAITSPSIVPFTFFNAGTCSNQTDFGVKRSLTYSVNDENSTWQGMSVTGVVKINDFDQEDNAQSFGNFLNPNTMAVITSGANIGGINKVGTSIINAGNLIFDANGDYTFNPVASFTGTVAVAYRICDNGIPSSCDTAFLSITVDSLPAVSNAVIANNDENISYGTTITNNLFANDRDPKLNSFTVSTFRYDSNSDGIPDITTLPGSITISGINLNKAPVANAGTLSIAANGSYTFVPTLGFIGTVDASYVITNSVGAISSANLHIVVVNDINGMQNDPPFAGDDFNCTTVNRPVSGSYIGNDRDPNNNKLSMEGTNIETAGLANPIGLPEVTEKGGKVQFYTNGTYLYTPPINYVGPDIIIYTICDVTKTAPQLLCANAILHFLVWPGITISGKVWDDGNGNVIPELGFENVTNVSNALYVSLIDAAGYVVATVPVAVNGTYSFNDVSPGLNYSLVLSNTNAAVGSTAPATTLPAGWVYTGETRNGTIDNSNLGIIDNRFFGYSSIVNFDFGIEQIPSSIPIYWNINEPTEGQRITLNGGSNPPILSGNDPEDCASTCTLNNRTVVIDQVPNNANLYYNGILVVAGQLITNFNPSLLQIEFTAVTLGSKLTEFYYSMVDAAGVKDPVGAIYSLNWLAVLPAKGLELTAVKVGKNTILNWKTISEINTNYFEIERSVDGRNYQKVGANVAAAGNSDVEKQYQSADDISNLQSPLVYYRIKLSDKNNRLAYSNVVSVKLPENGAVIKVAPNPFISEITVTILIEQSSLFGVRMLDVNGRTIYNNTQRITKETPTIKIQNMHALVKGIYIIEITDLTTVKKQAFKVEKINL